MGQGPGHTQYDHTKNIATSTFGGQQASKQASNQADPQNCWLQNYCVIITTRLSLINYPPRWEVCNKQTSKRANKQTSKQTDKHRANKQTQNTQSVKQSKTTQTKKHAN